MTIFIFIPAQVTLKSEKSFCISSTVQLDIDIGMQENKKSIISFNHIDLHIC
jgi:hypothetical protein